MEDFETRYINRRSEIMKEKLNGGSVIQDIKKVPRISLVCSGGGTRAAIFSSGCLQALEETGLLDYISYISASSGSTWSLLNWIINKPKNLKHELRNIVTKKINPTLKYGELLSRCLLNYSIEYCVNSVDMWGYMIACRFLCENRKLKSEAIMDNLEHEKHPFPIFSSICVNPKSGNTMKQHDMWMEFTASHIKILDLNIKTYLNNINHDILNGKIVKTYPIMDLSSLIGIWSSAFCVSFSELFTLFGDHPLCSFFLEYVRDPIVENKLQDTRISTGYIKNFTKGDPKSPIAKDDYILTVDSGIKCNIPLVPAAIREMDIHIICDSTFINREGEIKRMKEYVKKYGYDLPEIKVDEDRFFHIFKESGLPTIIYIHNEYRPNTLKFIYTEEEFETLFTESFNLIKYNKNKILDEILNAANN